MPYKPKHICNYIGCTQLTDTKYCPEHTQAMSLRRKEYYKNRPSYSSWYSTKRWMTFRLHWLRCHPLCVICKGMNEINPATVVDHIRPHKGDVNLFWDINNLQSLCKRCHDIKTAKQDGAFGNSRKV